MTTPRRLPLAVAAFATFALVAPLHAATVIDHEILFGADRVRIETRGGHTMLATPGSIPEYRAGRPDVPWFGESVDLPEGTRVTGVEILSIDTEPVAEGVRLPSAQVPKPGSGVIERTAPDPAYFTTDTAQPAVPVELGAQGFRRGQHEAYLRVSPVRWSPRTGRLDRVTRMVVRLTLESDASPTMVPRERVVREWEDAVPSGPSRDLAAGLTPMRNLKGRAQPFKATQVPSLLGSPVAYVIITNQTMSAQFQRLADWKTESGLPAVVRTMEFIRQQYPAGADDAERVRAFIRDAYSRWGTKWVLLGGDTDVIPVRYGYTTFFSGNYIANDLYYSCLDGNWNADGDSIYGEGQVSTDQIGDVCDLMPEVFIGRSPTTTVAEAQQFVDKVFQYSRTPVGDYEKNLLMFAEVLFPQDYTPGDFIILDGAELVEEVLPTFDTHPEIHYARLYENYADTAYRPGALPLSKAAVIDSFNLGYNVALHVGHGYRNVMSVGNETLDNSTAMAMTNGNRLTNIYAIDCTSNAIDFPSIGEAFMHASNGGAVSNIGSTNFDFPTAGRAYQDEYFKLLYRDSVTAVGEAEARQKYPFIAFSTYDGVNRWTQMTLLLLGDPEMHVWTNTPRILTVSHPATLALSDSQITVHVQIGATALYGARVTAYRPNDDFVSLTTDGAGNVTLPFRPDSVGTLKVTVTGFNCRPYQGTVTITPTAQALVVDPSYTVDDDNVGGTIGNGDGLMDSGETVDLKVPMRNNGGGSAPAVSVNITTTDGQVTILVPTVNYGVINAGATVNPSTGFRVSTPYTATDQREIPFLLTIFDGAGHMRTEKLQVTTHGPELSHYRQSVVDVGGNSDGVPDPGETVSYFVSLRNNGTGRAPAVSVKLRNYDGMATVLDSTSSLGDIPAGTEAAGDAVVFQLTNPNAKLELRTYDQFGLEQVQSLDLLRPDPPTDLIGSGFATSVKLLWNHNLEPDLFGYNIYRSTSLGGPFVRVNPIPTDRTSYYLDSGLAPLTPFYYKVTAVDSSGNESLQSFYAQASTTPPTHAIFPIPMGGNTPSSVAVDHLYPGYPMDIVAGADLLYVFHPDGTSPVDADGAGSTAGDFTKVGQYYAAGPTIADVTGDAIPEIVAPTWNDSSLYVYDRNGVVLPGWPLHTHDAIWSSAVVGDLNNDGSKEIAFASNGYNFYVMKANGSEWMDGDSNPTTKGVFKVLTYPSNYGSPVLADINGDGFQEIIYAERSGLLHAWNRFGADIPGFPVNLGGEVSASVAVGPLDGPGDPTLEIVVPTITNSLYVIEPDGSTRAGFPLFVRTDGTSKTPSPALVDMNNDGYLDIVQASTTGLIYVYNRTGGFVIPWNGKRYSSLTADASESSPVVADINGDGLPDVVMGSEDNTLAALSNNGTMLPGFPIILDGEVRGTPALCDCDGDGMTEIVLSGWDRLLHVWDYNFPYSPGHTPGWPQFHHDARRTGLATAPVTVDVPETPLASSMPASVELALPAPNPAHGRTRFDYAIPSDHAGQTFELSIFDLGGRKFRTIASGTAKAGRYSAAWDLRGEGGETARTGVYFVRFRVGAAQQSRKILVVR